MSQALSWDDGRALTKAKVGGTHFLTLGCRTVIEGLSDLNEGCLNEKGLAPSSVGQVL